MNATQQSQLQEQIKKLDSISTAPAILKPLLEMMRLPPDEIRIEKVVELVSYDGAIAAQCLRLANSPLYGKRETSTIRSAVMALGLERVRSMLLGLCLNRVIPKDKWVMEPERVLAPLARLALVTQRMAKIIEYPEPEKAYLAGLIYDIGFLVNSVLYTEGFRACLRIAPPRSMRLSMLSNRKFLVLLTAIPGICSASIGDCRRSSANAPSVTTMSACCLLPGRWPVWST